MEKKEKLKIKKKYWRRNQRTNEIVMSQGKGLFLNTVIEEQQNYFEQ